jgi:AmmeMemoRadiSam system protein A
VGNPTIALVDLGAEERRALLALAREVLEAAVRGGPLRPLPEGLGLHQRSGAFVTLRRGTELRGCIGHVPADQPLAAVVARMTVSAALEDPRFPPVAAEELSQLGIEISVLSELQLLAPPEPSRIRPGHDGVLVRRGWRQGLLLPQVATEQGWGTDQLLAGVCRKAGLEADAWRDTGTELYVFQVEAFGE